MSTLTGNQIKDTYQGLLKLADSSTGITQNLQAIEDGLGNNTGLRITTNQLEVQNIPSFVPLKAQYYGIGFTNINATQFALGTQNIIQATIFMDGGEYSYSAISFNTTTQTSSSDTFEAAIYSTQMINPLGLFPHTQIVSGITADTTSTGLKTYVFPSPISFSGYGGGIFWLVYKITNGGVQPTWRGGAQPGNTYIVNSSTQQYGITQQFTTLTFNNTSIRWNNTNLQNMVFTGLTTFDAVYSNTINTLQSSSTTVAGIAPGFILHTTNA